MTEKLERQIQKHGTWLFLMLIVVLILYMVQGDLKKPTASERATIAAGIFAGVGLLIAFVQARWASQQAEKASQHTEQALTTDVLFRLFEKYIEEDMHLAIRDIWQAMKQDGDGVDKVREYLEKDNRYQFLREYISKQQEAKRNELDKNRRRVTHFWYLIAILLDRGALREQDVFEWFGPPDIIWVLEGLEVIKQNLEMTGGTQKTRWPPLQVLRRYYKLKENVEILDKAMIPIVHIDQETLSRIRDL